MLDLPALTCPISVIVTWRTWSEASAAGAVRRWAPPAAGLAPAAGSGVAPTDSRPLFSSIR